MVLVDQVTLNQLRIFQCVYRTRSMTKAATEMHLTQSGISQHIKILEEALNVQLFDRIRQKIVPTTAGRLLYEVATEKLDMLEIALQQISSQEIGLKGDVVIGMPAEFGMNVIVPLLAKFMKHNPLVTTKVKIDLADEMNQMILNGEIDFAFVDDFKMDARVDIAKVYDEHLELCFSPLYLKLDLTHGQFDRKFFEALDYVAYKEDLPIIQRWFSHHYGMRKMTLNTKAVVSDVIGVARFIVEGIGIGVLPRHNIRKLQARGELIQVFPTKGKPLLNAISFASLNGRSQSAASAQCKTWLVEQLKQLKTNLESQK